MSLPKFTSLRFVLAALGLSLGFSCGGADDGAIGPGLEEEQVSDELRSRTEYGICMDNCYNRARACQLVCSAYRCPAECTATSLYTCIKGCDVFRGAQ